MSYDYSVWLPKRALSRAEAQRIHQDLCNGVKSDLIVPTAAIDTFLAEVTAKYPDINDYEEDEIDECPWNSGFDTSDSHVILCCAYSRIEDVETLLRPVAARCGLALYNPQSGEVCLPPGEATASRKGWRVILGGG